VGFVVVGIDFDRMRLSGRIFAAIKLL
jgi:hypothetical protein